MHGAHYIDGMQAPASVFLQHVGMLGAGIMIAMIASNN